MGEKTKQKQNELVTGRLKQELVICKTGISDE